MAIPGSRRPTTRRHDRGDRVGHRLAIDRGHYLPEERPEATAAELLAFFSG
jgi:hypothetical protein